MAKAYLELYDTRDTLSVTLIKCSHVVVIVTGDPATFIISLHQALKGYNCPADWVDMLKERDIEKEKANR